jgi:hypothetical protein
VFAWLDRAGGVPYMDPTFLAAYEAFGIPVTIEDSLSQVNLPDIEVIR